MFLSKDYFPILWQEWTDAYNALQVANGDICSDLLPNIICPTLIIQGDKDGVVSSEHPEYLEKNIKNSRSVWCHVIWSKGQRPMRQKLVERILFTSPLYRTEPNLT